MGIQSLPLTGNILKVHIRNTLRGGVSKDHKQRLLQLDHLAIVEAECSRCSLSRAVTGVHIRIPHDNICSHFTNCVRVRIMPANVVRHQFGLFCCNTQARHSSSSGVDRLIDRPVTTVIVLIAVCVLFRVEQELQSLPERCRSQF